MPNGVVYARRDLAGLPRRCLIVAIDGGVLVVSMVVLFIAIGLADVLAGERSGIVTLSLVALWALAVFLYMTVLKSRLGTLGYLLTGTRVVDLSGSQPSLRRMTARLVWQLAPWWLSGGRVFWPLADLLWTACDIHRQSLHDKLTGTYVVRRRAVPVARAHVRTMQLHVLGLTLHTPEARVPAST